MRKLIIWFFTITSIINFSCYAYYEIPKRELDNHNTEIIDRIRLKDKTEIILDKSGKVLLHAEDSLIVIQSDSMMNTIHLSKIDKFIRAEYSVTKTILFIFGLLAAAFGIFLWVMSGYNPGG